VEGLRAAPKRQSDSKGRATRRQAGAENSARALACGAGFGAVRGTGSRQRGFYRGV